MNKPTAQQDNLLCRILDHMTQKVKAHTLNRRVANYDKMYPERLKEPFYHLWVDSVLGFPDGQEALNQCRNLGLFYEDLFTEDVRKEKTPMTEVKDNPLLPYQGTLSMAQLIALQQTKLWNMEDRLVIDHGEEGLSYIRKCREADLFLLGFGPKKWDEKCAANNIDPTWIREVSDEVDKRADGNMFTMAKFLKEYPRTDVLDENSRARKFLRGEPV